MLCTMYSFMTCIYWRSSFKQVTIVFLALKIKIFNHFRVDIRRWQPWIFFGDEFRVKRVAAIWISWFLPRHSLLFWFKFIGSEPFWKARGRGWGGWVEVFCFRDCLAKTWGERGGGQLLLSTRHWLFWEMQCKLSDDFVEFCEFQSSIKQPAISVLCLILDRRQAISSLAGCLAIYILFIDRPDRLSLPAGDFFVEWGVKCTSSGMGLLFPIRANFLR